MSNNTKQTEIKDLLNSRRYIKNYNPPKKKFVLTIDEKKVGALQNIVVVAGMHKSGKSTYTSAMIASAFTTFDIFKMKINLPENAGRVALFDTENPEDDFYSYLNRIKNFTQLNTIDQLKFDAFNFREDEPATILKFIEYYLEHNKDCSCIFIDGILDLIVDFNNVIESNNIKRFLKQITKKYNILVVVILHLGRNEIKTLGHLGSNLDRYANSQIIIKKNKEFKTFEMSCDFLRSDPDEFETISIQYSKEGYFMTDTQKPYKKRTFKDFTVGEHKSLASGLMPEKGLQYKNIIEELKEREGVGTNGAKDIVKIWIAESIIHKKFNQGNIYFYDPN
jgi:hypothetical protein